MEINVILSPFWRLEECYLFDVIRSIFPILTAPYGYRRLLATNRRNTILSDFKNKVNVSGKSSGHNTGSTTPSRLDRLLLDTESLTTSGGVIGVITNNPVIFITLVYKPLWCKISGRDYKRFVELNPIKD